MNPEPSPLTHILIRGAREHNLRDFDITIPRDQFVVITGLSGSGKSTLAFDTIYAEGQRRYVESLSAYARQFLEQMAKPDVDSIDGLSPAVAIEQRTIGSNPRSTVGTTTEIYDYLRLLYARIGRPHCYRCDLPIASQTIAQMTDRVLALGEGAKLQVLAPVVRGRKGEYKKELRGFAEQGFVRVRIDGQIHELGEPIALDKRVRHDIEVVVDRLVARAKARSRIAESIQTALRLSDGLVVIDVGPGESESLLSIHNACVDYREPVYGESAPGSSIDLRVLSRHLRVDLVWDAPMGRRQQVERSNTPGGPFKRLDDKRRIAPVYSDYIGEANRTFYYRVRAEHSRGKYTPWSKVVKGRSSQTRNRDELLTEIQEACFRYFWHGAHPTSGLALEGIPRGTNPCATGATGMGLFTLVVGIERGFVSREVCAKRILKMLRFLDQKADRFHGGFSHWLNGRTGRVVPFGKKDNETDIVETSYLVEGFIFIREYFKGSSPDESEIRRLADKMWREVDWQWFVRRNKRGSYIKWHSADAMTLGVHGFNECQITYLLAIGSPTHPISPEVYWLGWERYRNQKPVTHFGVTNHLGKGLGGPLFFTHYSYMGFDPRTIRFGGMTYFDHFRNYALIQAKYADSRKSDFKGYGPMWGQTASYNPNGYKAHAPGNRDDGTITPTASLSSIPYAPDQGISCLVHMYEKHGDRLWGEFGFYDAFNFTADWVSHGFLGIDQGPIAPMIENHRTGLCWKVFMQAPEMQRVVDTLNETNRPR